ncbi:MAG TPA: hypothetical protein PLT98_00515, partial [Thauera aminoaromatica]|nr:hypothetical protein [Thauera aminoaromatica]
LEASQRANGGRRPRDRDRRARLGCTTALNDAPIDMMTISLDSDVSALLRQVRVARGTPHIPRP